MTIGAFTLGVAVGLVVGLEIVDRLIVRRLWRLVDYWRSEQVKARRDAVEAQKRWLDERDSEIKSGEWWKHTED